MATEQDARLDQDLKVNIPQNNPFRRGTSPMNSPPLSGSRADVRNANNPFLDPDLISTSPPKHMQQPRSPPISPPDAGMRNLSLADRAPPGAPPGAGHAASRLLQMQAGQVPPGRPSNRPPPGVDPRGPPRQRRSDERPDGRSDGRGDDSRRIRSASEERRRRERHERRKKEKEAGLKDGQGKSGTNQDGSRTRKPRGPQLDVIDKLDSTGNFLDPFGSGYHVAGPYDATISSRSRKLRPIDAFAKDSANMIMGGGKATYDKHVHANVRNLYGHVDDAANDYANAGMVPNAGASSSNQPPRPEKRGTEAFDATSKVEEVHGDETTGLGTSTFLEGTPAPASAIRRESESEDREQGSGGLSRTRSLAQRLRNQRGRDRSNSSGVVTSPERRPAPPPPGGAARTMSPTAAAIPGAVSLSGGGLDRIKESKNPFFEDYDDANEHRGTPMKTAGVGVTLEDKGMKPAPIPLTRSVTDESIGPSHHRTGSGASSGGEKEKKDGFLGRMKSLRGRKKDKTTE